VRRNLNKNSFYRLICFVDFGDLLSFAFFCFDLAAKSRELAAKCR